MDWEIEYRGEAFPVSVTREGDRAICIVGKKHRRVKISGHDISRADIRWNGDACEVVIDHVPYVVTVSPKKPYSAFRISHSVSRKKRTTDDGQRTTEVRAPMPCRVVEVRVKEGEHIAAGHVVAVVEAMKMQNELIAPRAGKVAAVQAAAGQAVEANQALITLAA